MNKSKVNKTSAFERKKTITGILFLIPMIVIIGVIILWPLFQTVRYSFYDWNGFSSNMKYVGLENYKTIGKIQGFKDMCIASVVFSAGVTLITVTVSFLIALLLDKKGKGRINRSLMRSLWFFPCLLSATVAGMLWKIMYNFQNGIINKILNSFGVSKINWLETYGLANVAVIVAAVWATAGMCIIIFLAGLQSMDQQLYEAAAIDGASEWQQIKHITLPMMAPSITINVLTTSINAFKMYELPKIITSGGPGSTTMLFAQKIADLGLESSDVGRGGAVSVLLILVITVISLIQFIYLRKREDIY